MERPALQLPSLVDRSLVHAVSGLFSLVSTRLNTQSIFALRTLCS